MGVLDARSIFIPSARNDVRECVSVSVLNDDVLPLIFIRHLGSSRTRPPAQPVVQLGWQRGLSDPSEPD